MYPSASTLVLRVVKGLCNKTNKCPGPRRCASSRYFLRFLNHSFRPAGAPELLCGGTVVIAEQAAQSLTTSHLPVRTANAFFRFEQRVPEPLMVALSVIMMDELSDGTAQRWLTEKERPLQALALDRQNKPFDVSVQIRRTVRQPNDICSGVLRASRETPW